MRCPYLEEVAMLFCRAYPVKKLVPRDRMTAASPCVGEGFDRCPLFQEIVARAAPEDDAEGRRKRTVSDRRREAS